MLVDFPQLSICHLPELVRNSVLVQRSQHFIHAIPAWSGAGALWPVLCWWIRAALFPNNDKNQQGYSQLISPSELLPVSILDL